MLDQISGAIEQWPGMSVGAVTVGSVAWWILRHQATELARAHRTETEDLKAAIKGIQANCVQHRDATAIVQLQTTMGEMQKAAARFEATAAALSREMTAAATRLESFEGWVKDVRSEERDLRRQVQEHMSDRLVHGGPRPLRTSGE